MKIFAIAATVLFAAVAYAAPAPVEARQSAVQITFEAGPAEFVENIPTDGSVFPINNDLSVNEIDSAGGATCTFTGVDGSVTTVVGAQNVTVAPPQTQLNAVCVAS